MLSLLVTPLLSVNALAQNQYPSKPIKLIVPFPPGGPADIFARALSEKLTTVFSQPVIIENKAGATGTIGASFVANAVPDGYTLLIGTSNEITMSPSLFKVMPYDPNKAFSPITTIATFPNVLVVNNNFKAKSFQDFLRIARSDPSGLNFASSGVGSTNDLTTLLFSSKTKIKLDGLSLRALQMKNRDTSILKFCESMQMVELIQKIISQGRL
jgi:tripartite-type tricarboxylate transporter receptor subunit TctC